MTDLLIQGVGMTSLRTRERLVRRLQEQGITHDKVLSIIRETPRHLFVDEALAHRAYEDTALPIGHGQTLSQPLTVARMTELLIKVQPSPRRILEVGTGSGYQTAILSRVAQEVFSLERIAPLHQRARRRLQQLGVNNVWLKMGDGFLGWPEQGPYDAIICTAAATEVPPLLLEQLAPGGVMLAPIGDQEQHLYLIERHFSSAQLQWQILDPVKFVPFLPGIIR